MLWSFFRHAVFAATDARNDERRRTRALERIAKALEEKNENDADRNADLDTLMREPAPPAPSAPAGRNVTYTAPPKGAEKPEKK